MESILKEIKKKKISINPAVVISNKPDAKGLKIAQKLGVNIEVVESKGFKGNRAEYDKQIISVLTKYGVTPRNGSSLREARGGSSVVSCRQLPWYLVPKSTLSLVQARYQLRAWLACVSR